MKVKPAHGIVSLILITLGVLVLVFGCDWFGWSELVRGNISVFVFGLATLWTAISHEWWKREQDEKQKRYGIFMGIYFEIFEALAISIPPAIKLS